MRRTPPDRRVVWDDHRRGTDGLHDSPLEERVYCELVSEKGDCGAWLIRPDSKGFLDDKTSVRALFLAHISQESRF